MLDLIVETSTNLPDDVREAIIKASVREEKGTRSAQALEVINQNIDQACSNQGAICQDTGMPTFYLDCPVGVNQIEMEKDIRSAIAEATRQGKLRPNSVDSLTGKNSGDNLGSGTPILHFHQWEDPRIRVRLILKGGGCENKNIQYALPCELEHMGRAGRDLDGVHKCILHAVWQAQGQGCSAGFIGVAVGGDRTSGYEHAKLQLFRSTDDVNPDPQLAKLEEQIMVEGNKLNIGTMGFGGMITLLGCKIGVINRIPASFFVSVAYDCWAFRRLTVWIDPKTGSILEWEQRAINPKKMAREEGFPLTGKEIRLTTPISEETARKLRVGDVVLLSGPMVTGRDEVHHYLMSHESPVNLNGVVLYHCGPVMLKDAKGNWAVQAAGPTTSMREEPYQADIVRKFKIRAVIGKGGMGKKTSAALKEIGAVYLNAIGGAAQFYARTLPKVKDVHLLEEFGVPEAMWEFEAKDFPAIVTMDSHGGSLHAEVEAESGGRLEQFRQPVAVS